MRRFVLAAILAVAIVFSVICATAEAKEEVILEFEDFQYVVRKDGSAELIRHKGEETPAELTIPNELDGHPIMAVRKNPFADYDANQVNVLVPQDHPYLTVVDGVLFGKSDGKLICYPTTLAAGTYAIPEGVQSIAECAFYWCDNLTGVRSPTA